jgi:tetratricopeptide (TPR) repeat protein
MSPEDLPQKDNEADKGIKTKRDGRLTRAISFLSSVWFIVPVVTVGCTILINYFIFGIPPFYEQARLEQSNSLADQHVKVGNMFLDANELEAAKQEFDKALQLAPGHTSAQQGAFKVDVFLDVTGGDPATTTSISESRITQQRLLLLLEENPNDADVWAYLACMSPDSETALDTYRRAVAIDPEHAYAYSGMASVYSAQEKWDQNLKMAKKAYELAPWKSIYHNNYANALSANERYHDAIAEYEDLIYSGPQYLWAYNDLAVLYRRTGDLQTSHSYGRQFIELSADEEIMSQNRDEQARFGPDSDPVYISADAEKRYYGYYNIALTSYLLGRTEEAKSYVNKAKDLHIDPYAASEIKRLMNYHIERLQEVQEQFRAKADDFRTKFL